MQSDKPATEPKLPPGYYWIFIPPLSEWVISLWNGYYWDADTDYPWGMEELGTTIIGPKVEPPNGLP